jgi:hypothetical protein
VRERHTHTRAYTQKQRVRKMFLEEKNIFREKKKQRVRKMFLDAH